MGMKCFFNLMAQMESNPKDTNTTMMFSMILVIKILYVIG
tara:strand:- start:2745 stop:2864 length:120 start_codon:yes stop_codon:yes gene_type:complete